VKARGNDRLVVTFAACRRCDRAAAQAACPTANSSVVIAASRCRFLKKALLSASKRIARPCQSRFE
jgi:hypothetical protein